MYWSGAAAKLASTICDPHAAVRRVTPETAPEHARRETRLPHELALGARHSWRIVPWFCESLGAAGSPRRPHMLGRGRRRRLLPRRRPRRRSPPIRRRCRHRSGRLLRRHLWRMLAMARALLGGRLELRATVASDEAATPSVNKQRIARSGEPRAVLQDAHGLEVTPRDLSTHSRAEARGNAQDLVHVLRPQKVAPEAANAELRVARGVRVPLARDATPRSDERRRPCQPPIHHKIRPLHVCRPMVGASVIGDGAMREERQPGCARGRASRRRTLPMLAAPVREGDRLRGHPVQVYRRGEHRVRPDRQREGVRHVPQRCKLAHQQGGPPDGKGLRARLERLAGVLRRLVPAAPQHDAVRLVEPRRGLPVPRMREHVNLLPTSGRVNHVLEVTRRAVAEQHALSGVASVVPLAVKVGRARADLGSEHAVKQ
mmetsp:Transcript_22821/g.69401  ORF Transcript_22821/g.69401 Transcript_22821/m.69401 type:complete len:430 (-) Transcript_22821:398-1687(-)